MTMLDTAVIQRDSRASVEESGTLSSPLTVARSTKSVLLAGTSVVLMMVGAIGSSSTGDQREDAIGALIDRRSRRARAHLDGVGAAPERRIDGDILRGGGGVIEF